MECKAFFSLGKHSLEVGKTIQLLKNLIFSFCCHKKATEQKLVQIYSTNSIFSWYASSITFFFFVIFVCGFKNYIHIWSIFFSFTIDFKTMTYKILLWSWCNQSSWLNYRSLIPHPAITEDNRVVIFWK